MFDEKEVELLSKCMEDEDIEVFIDNDYIVAYKDGEEVGSFNTFGVEFIYSILNYLDINASYM